MMGTNSFTCIHLYTRMHVCMHTCVCVSVHVCACVRVFIGAIHNFVLCPETLTVTFQIAFHNIRNDGIYRNNQIGLVRV